MILLTEEAYEAMALADKIVSIATQHNWTNWIVGGVADSRMINKLRMDLLDKDDEICRLRNFVKILQSELECETQTIDSYGVEGSNFRICGYCEAESGAGFLDIGIPHNENCPLHPNMKFKN